MGETCFYRIWFKSLGYFFSYKKEKKKKEKTEVCGFTLGFFMVLKMQSEL